jgi:hypothetical protein
MLYFARGRIVVASDMHGPSRDRFPAQALQGAAATAAASRLYLAGGLRAFPFVTALRYRG